jgi:predicted RNA-binding protein with PUA-like domain
MAKRYWLMKSEEDVYSIRDLEGDGATCWEGVRNYEARNLMRDEMRVGDGVLFYHSNAKPPGVAGIARVSKRAYPDHYALEKGNPYFDPKSDPENPRWFMVDVEYVEGFEEVVSLNEIKARPELADMALVKRARLSVQPVTKEEFQLIRKMGRKRKR